MAAHNRTEITVETDQVVIIRRGRSMRVWCRECGREADMINLAQAQALTGIPGLALSREAEARGWHVFYDPGDDRLFCLQSLLQSLARQNVHGEKS